MPNERRIGKGEHKNLTVKVGHVNGFFFIVSFLISGFYRLFVLIFLSFYMTKNVILVYKRQKIYVQLSNKKVGRFCNDQKHMSSFHMTRF